MSFLSRLIPTVAYAPDVTAAASYTTDPSTLPIASPWSTTELAKLVAEDVFGPDEGVCNTRTAAMRIPAVARARNLLCTAAARAVPVQLRVDQRLGSPGWFTASPGGQSPQLRMVWTVDDLLFYGWSCWWRVNSTGDGFPLNVQRINQSDWRVNGDSRVEVNGSPVDDDQVILIPGYHGGILDHGRDAITQARALLRNVAARLKYPIPGVDLHQTGGRPLTEPEQDRLIERWKLARESGGSVGFSSQDIEVKPMGADDDGRLMIESRNASALDLARVVGIGAGLLDATAPKSSLNYETTQLRNQEFIDRDLSGYLDPIAARLSLDDVTPHGNRIAFDVSDQQSATPAPTGPTLED